MRLPEEDTKEITNKHTNENTKENTNEITCNNTNRATRSTANGHLSLDIISAHLLNRYSNIKS